MRQHWLTPIIYICMCGALHAQQLPQFSMWMLDPYMLNPSMAGVENTLIATGAHRNQWSGLDGAPVGQNLSAHLPLSFIRSGTGLKIQNDQIGAHQTIQVMADYSYHLDLSRSATLSLGAGIGYQQYTLDGTKLRAPEGDYVDPAFQHNDAFLPSGRIRIGASVFEAGALLRMDRLDIGVSAIPVFAPVIKEKSPGKFQLQPSHHFTLTGAYRWDLSDYLLLQPALLLKSDGRYLQADLNLLATWKARYYIGAGFRGYSTRSRDAVVVMAGLHLNDKTKVLYAHDLPVSGLQTAHRGSHELLLQYNWGKPIGEGKLPPVIYNPRYL